MEDLRGLRVRTHARAAASEASPNGSNEDRRGLPELRQLARDGADPVALLEDAYRAVFDASPRFSHRQWGGKLRAAVRRGDHYGLVIPTRGYAVGWLIDRMLEDRDHDWRPASLAFYAQRLRVEARLWRSERRAQAPVRVEGEAIAA